MYTPVFAIGIDSILNRWSHLLTLLFRKLKDEAARRARAGAPAGTGTGRPLSGGVSAARWGATINVYVGEQRSER